MDIDEHIKMVMEETGECDPDVITDALLNRKLVVMSREFRRWATRERVREIQRSSRNHIVVDDLEPAIGPSKWAVAIRNRAPFVDKFIDELTVDDLNVILASYDAQIAAGMKQRERYERMLEQLKASGCATVGEMHAARQNVAAAA